MTNNFFKSKINNPFALEAEKFKAKLEFVLTFAGIILIFVLLWYGKIPVPNINLHL
jgi:hypothetical protein